MSTLPSSEPNSEFSQANGPDSTCSQVPSAQ
jgi:hypothetical protein